MKKTWNYYKIKWVSFFITVLVLGVGLLSLFLSQDNEITNNPKVTGEDKQEGNQKGHYTNEQISEIIQNNLTEVSFLKDFTFQGLDEGKFTMKGTLSRPEYLSSICQEFKPFSSILESLKGEIILVSGHLGEDHTGNGRFVIDTVSVSEQTIPAGFITEYIEQYTGLNDLLEVPLHQIEISSDGITFTETIPTFIQTVLYK